MILDALQLILDTPRLDPSLPIAPAIVVAQAAISAQSRKSPSGTRRASSSARSPNPSLLRFMTSRAAGVRRAHRSWISPRLDLEHLVSNRVRARIADPPAGKQPRRPGRQLICVLLDEAARRLPATARRRRRCRGPPRVAGQVADLLDWAHVREDPALPRAIREHVWHHQRARGAEEGHHPLAKVDDLPGSWPSGRPAVVELCAM